MSRNWWLRGAAIQCALAALLGLASHAHAQFAPPPSATESQAAKPPAPLTGTGCDAMRPSIDTIKACSALIARQPHHADALAIRGNAYRQNGDTTAALADLNAALTIDPGHMYALGRRVMLATGLPNRIETAIQADIDRINAVNPTRAADFEARGMARWARREFPKAIEEFTAGLNLEPSNLMLLVNRAGAHANMVNYAAALADYDKVVAVMPGYALAHAGRGNALRAFSKHAEAVAAYDEAIRIDPARPVFHVDRGRLHLTLRNNDKALADLDKAIELNPSNYWAHFYRGQAHFARGERDKAITDYNTTIALNQRFAGGYVKRGEVLAAQGNHPRALTDFNKAIEVDPKVAEAHFRRGTALLHTGDVTGAIAALDEATKLDPKSVSPYIARSDAKLRQSDAAGAVADATKAIELSPSSHNALLGRAQAHVKLGRVDLAITDLTKAHELAPRVAEVLNRRADAYQAIGDAAKAAADRKLSLEMGSTTAALKAAPRAPRPPGAQSDGNVALEVARQQLERGELDQAIAEIDKVIVTRPTAFAYLLRGTTLLRKLSFARSLADHDKAIELYGSYTDAYASRCLVHILMRSLERARADCTKAIEIGPATSAMYARRAWTHGAQNAYDKAIADYDKALELAPKNTAARASRGLIHFYAKQFEQATADFRQVLTEQPANEIAVRGLKLLTEPTPIVTQPMRFSLVRMADAKCADQCAEWISASGAIDALAPERFRAMLRQIGKRKVAVFIDSGGGNMGAAMQIGRMIRARGLDVYVTQTQPAPCPRSADSCRLAAAAGVVYGVPRGKLALCSSACTSILAAGTVRGVGKSSLVGVHQAAYYERKSTTDIGKATTREVPQIIYTMTKDYLVEMGVDANLMIRLLATPHARMYWLSRQELQGMRLATVDKSGEELITGSESDAWIAPSPQAIENLEKARAGAAAAAANPSPAPAAAGAAAAAANTAAKAKVEVDKAKAVQRPKPPTTDPARMCFNPGSGGGGGMIRCNDSVTHGR